MLARGVSLLTKTQRIQAIFFGCPNCISQTSTLRFQDSDLVKLATKTLKDWVCMKQNITYQDQLTLAH
jgi:hypothetical protein